MPVGVPTPRDKELEFRKHYLVTGNIRASARQVKIPQSTGHVLATRANADPEFVQARAEMYARVMPDAECMLREALEIAMERLEQGPEPMPKVGDMPAGSKVQIQDPCPAYLRGIVDGYKALTMNRKMKDASDGAAKSGKTEVHIHLAPDDKDESGKD